MEELAWVMGVHRVGLSLYRATRGRRSAPLRKSMSAFFRALLPPDALVFDIGANVGTFSSIFSSLGARVVALEPNSDCVRHIQLSYVDAKIEVIQAVAGPENGLCRLNVSDEIDLISSVSDKWINSIQRVTPKYAGLWSRQLTVPMVTIDTLIKHYGAPYFVKIDVEGFEESVLDGLSTQPPLVSFEFHEAFPDATMQCLDKGVFARGSLFNFAMEDPVSFELKDWARREQLKEVLSRMRKGDKHGDIFVRSPASHD